jgi:hypothetical protein
MEMILETMTKLVDDVDISVLFMSLMRKIGKYFGDNLNNKNNNELNEILESAQNVYPVLLNNFEIIINANINNENIENIENKNKKQKIINMPLIKLLELIDSFMNFSIKCSPQEQKLNGIIKILNSALEIVKKFKNKYAIEKKELNEQEKKKIYEILFSPLEGSINIFDIEAYNQLMEYLDYKQKKNIGIEIINVLVNNRNNPLLSKLDSIENLQKIIKYIKPLLTDNKNNN